MLLWFKVLVINSLFSAILFAVNGNSKDNLNYKQKRIKGMSLRTKDIEDWLSDAYKYNTSSIHSLKEIYNYLALLAECPYGHVKLQNLTIKRERARLDAITEQGNYIPYLNISIGSYVQKPAVVIIGGAMGCHWLTVAAAINLAKRFAIFYEKNYEYTSKATWIIIPVLNPDGYHITLEVDEMRNWKKNLAKPPKQFKKKCFGVNLCMNFEYQWISYDYKNTSWCDDHYADRPFSQNESKSVRDTVSDHLDTVKIFIQLQQNRRLLMYPFRFTSLQPIFWKVYTHVVQKAAKAAFRTHHRRVKYGHVLNFKNKTAGELDDWVMAHLGVNLGFTYEIAEWENNDNAPSRKEIQWTNDETLAALKTIGQMGIKFKEMGFLPSSDTNVCSLIYSLNIFVIILIILTPLLWFCYTFNSW